jgi:hypothetical protein
MKTNFSSALRSGVLVALLATAACRDQDTVAPIAPADLALDAVAARLDFSTLTASAGSRVSVTLRAVPPAGARLAGLDGSLTWDPRSLRYEGQIAADGWPMAMTNAERALQGVLPLHVVHPHGLSEDVATFSFTVLRPSYDQVLRFQPTHAVEYDGAELVVRAAESRMDASIESAAEPQLMDMWDWIAHVEGRAVVQNVDGPAQVFGLSDVYGDANGDGVINATDVGYVANAAVGNNVLGPITTPGPRDAVAINVQPVNLPGLGEPGDTPPGLEANGNRLINASDNSFIAQEAVGIDRPIVGEAIPRPPSTTFACFPGTGTYVSAFTDCGVGAGTAEFISLSDVTLTNDRIWIVADIVLIGRDGTRDADIAASLGVDEATLTIEPGTTVWGTDEGAIVVTRAGRIFADGTYSQPITLNCVPPASGPRVVNSSNGCWGGLVITGNATLPDAKVPGLVATITGRAGGGGISSAVEGMPTEDVYYGGDNDLDDCGSLSYLVVAHGGRRLDANNEFNNITIAGCGTPTDVSYVQAHNGSDDGLEIFGGGFDVDHVYLTANNDDQFDYSFGFEGIVQYVLVQQLGVGDKGFEVDNTENSATYNNTPRTDAAVYNFTMVGGTDATTTSKTANNYRNGAYSSLFNGLIIQYSETFDIDTEASCGGVVPGDLMWQNTVLLSSSAASYSSAAGICQDATGGAQAVGSAAKLALIPSNVTETTSGLPGTNTLLTARAYASDLQDPFSTQFADFRPLNDGVTAPFAPVTPPSGTGAWFGAFQPTGIVTSLPWSAGWTIGWQLAGTP